MERVWPWVSARLIQRGWSQTDLAGAAGVSPNVITRLKQGGEPDLANLDKIARALDSTLVQMLDDCGYGTAGAPSVLDAIAADTSLLPEAKDHLTRQYGLLLRVGKATPVSDGNARKRTRHLKAARRGGADRGDLEE